jgi:hypothetical protein
MFVLLTILSALIAILFVASVVATIHELKSDSADKRTSRGALPW